jgi:hypothetical protein
MLIAESDRITSKDRKRELLEEAFRVAAGAQQTVRLVSPPGSSVDTRAGYRARAHARKLDALSLQTRAVRAMMALDGQRARRLFAEIHGLQLPPLGCEDALVYEVSDYYDALGGLARTAFSEEEVARNADISFVQPYVSRMTSPAQVGPLARVVLAVGENRPDGLSRLARDFGAALAKISGDDRSFSFSVAKGSGGVAELLAACKQQNIPAHDLLKSARGYFVRHLSGRRCADNVAAADGSFSNPEYVDSFNCLLSETALGGKTPAPITADEIKPSAVAERAVEYPYWQTPEAKRLLARLKELRFGADNRPLTEEQKKEARWLRSLRGLLDELTAWDGGGEASEADFFHQKSTLFEGLLKAAAPGPERDDVLNAFQAFLINARVRQDSRIDWFLHAEFIIKAAHAAAEPDRPKLLEMLTNSGDPTLRLYARLEQW